MSSWQSSPHSAQAGPQEANLPGVAQDPSVLAVGPVATEETLSRPIRGRSQRPVREITRATIAEEVREMTRGQKKKKKEEEDKEVVVLAPTVPEEPEPSPIQEEVEPGARAALLANLVRPKREKEDSGEEADSTKPKKGREDAETSI